MNKTAIVTGGASGIGREIVKKFIYNGYDTVIADIDIESAEKLAFELNQEGKGKAVPVLVNVSSEESVQNLISTTADTFGKLDILINSAAIQTVIPFEQLTFNE